MRDLTQTMAKQYESKSQKNMHQSPDVFQFSSTFKTVPKKSLKKGMEIDMNTQEIHI